MTAMADPLSITASVLGVTTAALQSVQYLVSKIDNVKSVPEAISNVKSDLQAVQPVLKQLEQSEQSGGHKTLLIDEIKPAVQNCGRACDAFQKQLDHWMRHSSADKTFWADRFRVALFGQERTQALRAQLNDCKLTITVAMSSAT